MTYAFGIVSKKSLLNSRSERDSPMFSSRIFIVLAFTVTFIIYFKFIFLC